jgi:hypothetical protein
MHRRRGERSKLADASTAREMSERIDATAARIGERFFFQMDMNFFYLDGEQGLNLG